MNILKSSIWIGQTEDGKYWAIRYNGRVETYRRVEDALGAVEWIAKLGDFPFSKESEDGWLGRRAEGFGHSSQ